VSVAEVLDPDAEALIERAWGARPRQVYQATEGLLALPCESGALHLNEESVRIDREWLDAERTRFVPLVTDFDRRTQIIVRHRLDDVLRIDPHAPERCSCGRVTTRLAGIDGRADAVLRLPSADGTTTIEVFPDAMAVESEGFSDWRIRQRGVTVHVELADPAPDARARVERALTSLLETWGCRASLVHDDWTPPDPEAKRRRIVRESP
jgi:putative adenylate-forming enzyme